RLLSASLGMCGLRKGPASYSSRSAGLWGGAFPSLARIGPTPRQSIASSPMTALAKPKSSLAIFNRRGLVLLRPMEGLAHAVETELMQKIEGEMGEQGLASYW